jgi:hypothetical protein
MIINTTFHVSPEAEEAFKTWIHESYIPHAIEQGKLHSPLFMRIMTPMEGGTGYAVQLRAAADNIVEQWLTTHQPIMLQDMTAKWGQGVMYFTTLMEEVEK